MLDLASPRICNERLGWSGLEVSFPDGKMLTINAVADGTVQFITRTRSENVRWVQSLRETPTILSTLADERPDD